MEQKIKLKNTSPTDDVCYDFKSISLIADRLSELVKAAEVPF